MMIDCHKSFDTDMDEIDNANEWYAKIWEGLTENIKLIYSYLNLKLLT